MTPDERLAATEESVRAIKNDITLLRSDLAAHTLKDDQSFDQVRTQLDSHFSSMLGTLHRLEVTVLTTKADAEDVSQLKKHFWVLLGLLAGSGVLVSGAFGLFGGS